MADTFNKLLANIGVNPGATRNRLGGISRAFQRNPGAMIGGIAFGAGASLVLENEGRGPIGQFAFWGPAGAALGLGISAARKGEGHLTNYMKAIGKAPTFVTNPGVNPMANTPYAGLTSDLYGQTPNKSVLRRRGPRSTDAHLNTARNALLESLGLSMPEGASTLDAGMFGDRAVPSWLQRSLVQSEARSIGQLTNRAGAGIIARSQDEFQREMGRFSNWGDVVGSIEGFGVESDVQRGAYAKHLSGSISRGSKAQMGTGVTLDALNIDASNPRPARSATGNVLEMEELLGKQGKAEIGKMIKDLHGDVKVVAQRRGDIIETLEMTFPGNNKPVIVNILDKDQSFRAGPGLRNRYVARKEAFLGSLEVLEGGNSFRALDRPWLLDADEAIVRYVNEYYRPDLAGPMRGFVSDLAESAFNVEYDPRRWDRPIDDLPRNAVLRRNSVRMRLPESPEMLGALGMTEFGKNIVDPSTGVVKSNALHSTMRSMGWVQAAGEGQARNLVFQNLEFISRLNPAGATRLADKPMPAMRDLSKGYQVIDKGGSSLVGKRPAGYYETPYQDMRNLLKNDMFAVDYRVLQDVEVNYLREQLSTPEGVRNLRKMAVQAARGSDAKGFEVFHALRTVARMDEGIHVSALPRGVMMQNLKPLVIDELHPDLARQAGLVDEAGNVRKGLTEADLQRGLRGKTLTSQSVAGYVINQDGTRSHTYFQKGGTAKIADVTVQNHPRLGRRQFHLVLEEMIDGRFGKSGTTFGTKTFNRPILSSTVSGVMRFMNDLRKKRHSIYGDAVVPLLTGEHIKNTVPGFITASQIKKAIDPEVMINNLRIHHYANMTKTGRGLIDTALGGIDDVVKSGTAVDVSRKTLSTVRATYEDMYSNPGKYFGAHAQKQSAYSFWNERLLQGHSSILSNTNPKGVSLFTSADQFSEAVKSGQMAAIDLERHGYKGMATLWDHPVLSVPRKASLTHNEISLLGRFGFNATAEELISRRRMPGDLETTRAFNAVLLRAKKMGGFDSLSSQDLKGTNIFHAIRDAEDLTPIRRTSLATGKSLAELGPWVNNPKFQNNFMVDVAVAEGNLRAAGQRVREALGGSSRIFVPGAATDYFQSNWLDMATGKTSNSTSFMPDLQATLRNVHRYYESGGVDTAALAGIRSSHASYLQTLHLTMTDLDIGRGGVVKDAGPAATGKVAFEDYRRRFGARFATDRRFKGNLELANQAASRIRGISPEHYDELLAKKNVKQIEIAGTKFLQGVDKRFPITEAGPALVYADREIVKSFIGPDLRGTSIGGTPAVRAAYTARRKAAITRAIENARAVMWVDGTDRYLKKLDYDGDTAVAHILTSRAAQREHKRFLFKEDGFETYRAFVRQGRLIGGMQEDLASAATYGLLNPADTRETVGKRYNQLAHYLDQNVNLLASKAKTSAIGWHSNAAKLLMTTIQDGMGAEEQALRIHLSNELQQYSIDFARESTKRGMADADPTQFASHVRNVVQKYADNGDVQSANVAMRELFIESGLREEFQKSFTALRADPNKYTGTDLADFERLYQQVEEGFFTAASGDRAGLPLRQQELSKLFHATRGATKKTLGAGSEMRDFLDAAAQRAAAGHNGIAPSIGSAAEDTRKAMSAWRRAVKGARGAGHILSDMGKKFMRTPEGQAAAALATGGLAVAGAMGLMSSPVDYEGPGAPGGAERALMRTPDAAFVGIDGNAPIPGSRGGQVASHEGPALVPRPDPGVFMDRRKFYYDQVNRVPQFVQYSSMNPERAAMNAAEVDGSMRRSMGGGSSQVNVMHSPTARRVSQTEMDGRVRNEMLRD